MIHAYLDGELDVVRTMESERHILNCPRCGLTVRSLQSLRAGIAGADLYYKPPPGLEKSVRAAVRRSAASESSGSRPRWAWAAAAVVLMSAAVVFSLLYSQRPARNLLAGEILASHVRSLMADHLYDVASTNEHNVKPWFDGKLDFSPVTPNFEAEGFPLKGGRLDYVGGRPVAALVYSRGKHVINLFEWPDPSPAGREVVRRQGYVLIHFPLAGMSCWAVSDASEQSLQQFVALTEGRALPTTSP